MSVSLTSESVQSTSLPLEGIDDIHSSDSLPLGVFSVGDSISDDILKENLQNSTSLLIDESRDTLDSTTTSQPPDSGLGNTLDVVSQHLSVTLSASLSQSLSTFTTSSHVADVSMNDDYPRVDLVYMLLLHQSEVLVTAAPAALDPSERENFNIPLNTCCPLYIWYEAHITRVSPAIHISFI